MTSHSEQNPIEQQRSITPGKTNDIKRFVSILKSFSGIL
jgi:hypothetical protein